MYKILVATDGSEHAEKTIDEVIKIGTLMNADITVITVVEDKPMVISTIPYNFIESIKESMNTFANTILQAASERFKEKGLTIKTLLKQGHPANVICEVAEKGNFDLIALGNRGLGKIEGLLLGSISNRIAHCSKTSVLIVK